MLLIAVSYKEQFFDFTEWMKNQLNSIGLQHSVEAVYTGGAIQWSLDGKTLFSSCGSYIRASNIYDGKER